MYALLNGGVEVVSRVAFAIGLTAIPFIGMWGIWLTTGLTWTITGIVSMARYHKGKWIYKSVIDEEVDNIGMQKAEI